MLLLPGEAPVVPCVPCRGERVPRQLQETPGASSGIPLPGQLSLSPPLGMIFTIKDLVLSLVLHPVCRCLQVLFAVAAVSRLKACPSGQEIRGLPLHGHRHSQRRGSMSQMAAQFPGAC